jgi:hypothetical protein
MPGRGLSFTILFKPDVIIFIPRHNKEMPGRGLSFTILFKPDVIIFIPRHNKEMPLPQFYLYYCYIARWPHKRFAYVTNK